jgi:NAD(P)-dependent dehydrogenase (short-subunit alcohol dehydrogenase family)
LRFLTCTFEKSEIDVRNLRVLVSAGGGGIGRAIAESFAASGAQVLLARVTKAATAATRDAVPGLTAIVGAASSAADDHVGPSEQRP